MLSLLRHELTVRRGGILGWSAGLSVYAGLYTVFFPAMPAEMLAIDYENIGAFQAFGDITMGSFEGYMGSSIYNFLGVLVGIFAVLAGVGALAGEEESGTLENLVTLPLPRWKIVAAKATALAISLLVVLSVTGTAIVTVFLAVRDRIPTSVGAFDLFLAALALWPLALAFLGLGLFLGALLPRRRWAAAAAATLLAASFFGNNLAGMYEALEALSTLSPFNYVDTSAGALEAGPHPWDIALLFGVGALFVLLAVRSFGERDLTVGRWGTRRRRRSPASTGRLRREGA